jgi:hypothetical protein
MQVVVMGVGDEDHVDLHVVNEVRDGIAMPVEEAQTIYEQRVGENADAIDVEQNRRVPEVP